jgi:hypothetical protein
VAARCRRIDRLGMRKWLREPWAQRYPKLFHLWVRRFNVRVSAPAVTAEVIRISLNPSDMNVIYSTHTDRDYMPPLAISERQVTVGPGFSNWTEHGRVRSLNVAYGQYDLAALVASLPSDQRPELTVVLADSYQNCIPRNLARAPGRKLLLAGDTHHGPKPLEKMLTYARQEPFDGIVVIHDPHHLHWYVEAGFEQTTYIPNINVAHLPQRFDERRKCSIVFVGQAGHLHARRQYLLGAIKDAGLSVEIMQATATEAALRYSGAQITFNCSLNGDLNMRVFEVLSAGGFLVTDRLSRQSALEALFLRGEHYVDYNTVDDLIEKLRYYLARPAECLEIARAGHAAYVSAHLPQQRIRDVLDFAFARKQVQTPNDKRALRGSEAFGSNLNERVQLYQVLQDLCLRVEQLVVVGDAALGARPISDWVDLPRAVVLILADLQSASALRQSLERLGVSQQVRFIEQNVGPCDVLVLRAETLAGIADLRKLNSSWLAVMNGGPTMAKETERLAAVGFVKVAEAPWLFRRTPLHPSLVK